MRPALLLSFFFFVFSSCSTERGTVEIESLSRKVFDALKANDFGGIREIIPSKGNFTKIYAMQGKKTDVDIDTVYEQFLINCEADFKRIRSAIPNWNDAVYANTNESVGKEDNVSFTTVTAKFRINNEPKRLTFTGAKINGRWYYYAGLQWEVQETEVIN